MGGLFGGGSTTTTTVQDNSPWIGQQPFLSAGFQAAQDIYNQQKGTPAYSGELYAALNPTQLDALSNLNLFSNGIGNRVASTLLDSGVSASTPALSQALAAGGNLVARATTDPTQTNISSASAYANNPFVQGMIEKANRPIEQQLTEAALPGMNVGANATGNTDSSRSAITEAILRRNAGTQEADNAANIMGTQYASGLDLAEKAREANLSSLSSSLGWGGLSGLASTGANIGQTGYQDYVNNLNIPVQTGSILQQNQQNLDQAALQSYNMQLAQPWNLFNNYWNTVGNKVFGSTTSGTTTATNSGPGLIPGLLGTATGIGSLFVPTGPFGYGPSIASSIAKLFGGGGSNTGG